MMQASGPLEARVMIVGEAPGEEEERQGRPFVGTSGRELDRLLHEVGLLRSECFVTNVIPTRPPGGQLEELFRNDRKTAPGPGWAWSDRLHGWAHPSTLAGLAQLDKEIALVKPQLIIALGNLALQATAGQWSVAKWRGSYLPGPGGSTVIPTYHPTAVLRNWASRPYVVSDLRRAAKVAREGAPIRPNYKFQIRPSLQQVALTIHPLLERAKMGPVHLAVDIETRAGMIACLGFAWSKTEALCIPLMCVERPEGYWSHDEEAAVTVLLRQLLTHPNVHVSGQNFSYDSQYIIKEMGFVPNLSLDTMLTHHVCMPGTDKGLDVLSSLYCEHHVYWKDDRKEWPKGEGELQLWSYNCMDCVRTWEIAEALTQVVQQFGVLEQAVFQHRMWWRSMETMLRGVRADAGAKGHLSKVLEADRAKREKWITETLGHPLNVRSAPQMKKLFYEDFQCKVILNRKTRQPSLDDEALAKIASREPLLSPVVKRIQEIRSLGVFRSTFVEARADRDGRMRCSYNVAGTETFRFSSSKNPFNSGLNLQNIPSGDEDSDPDFVLPNVRKLFLADPGKELADMDLNAADLRIVVAEAGEETMQEMLDAGLDPYTEIAKEFYHDPSITKKDPRRQKFKGFAHGTHYLGTAKGLAERLGLKVKEAEDTQRWYFSKFPRIEQWHKRLKGTLESKRYVANVYGYRRYFFDRIEGTLYNQAAAWVPQSTVGLLINRIWDHALTHEPGVEVLLQVHDSLVFQYPADRADYYRARLRELSQIPVPYARPIVIPTGFKTSQVSWGDCK